MLVVGLMSGTSLDGIDASLIKIKGHGKNTELTVIKSISIPYDKEIKNELLAAMDKNISNVEQICSLNYKLGYMFADAVYELCNTVGIKINELDLIGSHGQTVYHLPDGKRPLVPSTLQIGEPAVIAFKTETPVVSNFRAMDIAAGGEGAPLIPYIDWLLFTSNNKGRILQNIGGIGNCTVLKKEAKKEDVYAFDTGPGNMIIDELCRTLFNIPYDDQGKIAAKGKVHEDIVKNWMNHSYFQKIPPKSTGREEFGKVFTMKIIQEYSFLPKEDLIATATYFTALSIADAYKRYIFPFEKIDEVIISGGGGNNPTLVKMIQQLLPELEILKIDELGITTDEKEAVGFAILAHEYIHQQRTNLKNATGANHSVLLGQLTLPPFGSKRFTFS